jgi:hypothetical protein
MLEKIVENTSSYMEEDESDNILNQNFICLFAKQEDEASDDEFESGQRWDFYIVKLQLPVESTI